MTEIVVDASDMINSAGAMIVGFWVSIKCPKPYMMRRCEPVALTRVYHGYGKTRAETGKSPRKGFGDLIGGLAEITDAQKRQGLTLWLLVQD